MKYHHQRTALCGDVTQERPSDCALCAVRQFALFSAFKAGELDERLQGIRNAFWAANTVIYSVGQPSEDVFSIRSGVVKLVQPQQDRTGRIVRLLGRGAAIGLEALDGRTYAHTAVTTRESNLCRIPRSVLRGLGADHPQLCEGLVRKWREHTRSAEALVAGLEGGTLDDRARSLLRLLVEVSGDHQEAVRFLRNDDMANLLCVSAESVSRCVARLKRGGIIRRVGPWTYDCTRVLAG